MIITWWLKWWRQRGRVHHRAVWLRQRDLGLESLEDRRLLSAVLVSDPILKALANEKPPTADVAIVRLDASPVAGNTVRDYDMVSARGAGVTADDYTPAVISWPDSTAGQPSHNGNDPVSSQPSSLAINPPPAGQPEGVISPSVVDATFAAGLAPVAGDPTGLGRVQPAGAAGSGSGVLDGGPSLADADDLVIGAGLTTGGASSSATSGDSQGSSIAPVDSGSGSTVAAQGFAPFAVLAPTPVGDVGLAVQLVWQNQASNGTGDGSGGHSGSTAVVGTGTTDSPSPAGQGTAPGVLTAADPESANLRTRGQSSDDGDQGDTSGGNSDDNTGTPLDDGSVSSGGDGQSPGKIGARTDHSQPNHQTDSADQAAAADNSSSAGAGRHSGRGGRARGSSSQAAGDPTGQASTGSAAPIESTTDAGTTIPSDAGTGEESTGSNLTAVDPGGASLVVDLTDQPAATPAGTAGHHHHHRIGPFFVPTMSAADLNYGTTDWCQASDGGMDDSGGYFQQNCDFTSKVTNLGNLRPDGLARADKDPALGERTDWRYLGSPIRGGNGTPVLISRGNASAALPGGEGAVEGLDLVYNFQAAAAVRGSGVARIRHVPARTLNRQDVGLGDRSPALAGSASFFATRALPPAEAGRGHDRGSWQVAAVAAAEVDPERIEHLVAGSFAARHLNSDGDGSGDSQRLDGRGWWGIVGQFILAPQFPHNHQPTIMLAVADEPSRDALNVALVKANFLVLTAATAREAMKLLRTPLSPVDVALLDVHLPDVNGVDLCSRLRELYPTLPVLVCTDQAEHGDVNQLQKLNVLRIFSKPVAIGELLAAVKGIVS